MKEMQRRVASRACLRAGLPQLKALWESYHDAFDLDALLVPATIATARPISDAEPFMTVNGKRVCSTMPGLMHERFMNFSWQGFS